MGTLRVIWKCFRSSCWGFTDKSYFQKEIPTESPLLSKEWARGWTHWKQIWVIPVADPGKTACLLLALSNHFQPLPDFDAYVTAYLYIREGFKTLSIRLKTMTKTTEHMCTPKNGICCHSKHEGRSCSFLNGSLGILISSFNPKACALKNPVFALNTTNTVLIKVPREWP